MPTSEAHEFVYGYLREKRDIAKKDGGTFSWEDSQNALKEAWAIAKEKGLATTQAPVASQETVAANPTEEHKMFTINPITKRGDMFRIREAEIKADNAQDRYDAALQRYGMEDERTFNAYNAMVQAQRAYGRVAYQNPKMPVGYYRDLPPSEPVVVRQYERKLPKRPGVQSRETPYKRLKRAVARLVGGEHDTLGNRALQFEVQRGGGPVMRRRIEEAKAKRNPMNGNMRIALMSALALAGLVFVTRGTE